MMLHRLKLKVVYGESLSKDKVAKRLKMRVILIAGFAVFIPFLAITYMLWTETRVGKLLIIGLLSALSCVPVVLYAYAKGYGKPLKTLWKERPEELKWLSLKIGFFYGFALYWMILGIVEFLFGYQSFRAALISFVASAAARDGFEIGYLRARDAGKNMKMTIFPDDRPLSEMFPVAPQKILLLVSTALLGGAITGFVLGPVLLNPIHQALVIGLIVGGVSTLSYAWALDEPPSSRALLRYFIWPGFTMGITYFLILAYLLRIVFEIKLAPASDFGLLMAASAAWLTLGSLFDAYLQWKKTSPATEPSKGEVPQTAI